MSRMTLTRTGVELAVEDCGQGPAVVFLHGLAGFRQLWSDAVARTRAGGFRCISYDHRGHGESSDAPAPWTIRDLADDLASVLDDLDIERACIVGHSMGGRVMFDFALERPDRVWAVVAVAAQSETPRPPYRETLVEVRNTTVHEGLPGFRRAFEAAGEIPGRIALDAAFAAEFEARFAHNRAAMLAASLDAILVMPALTPRIHEITVPALAIVGELDEPFREIAALYERRMTSCRTTVVPSCHHYPMTDQPAAFTKALTEFLKTAAAIERVSHV